MRLIDADKAIEIWKEKDFIKFVGQEEKAKMLLDVLPTEPRWIPVSERLPEEGQNVLFCDIDGDIMFGYHVKGQPDTHFTIYGIYENVKDVKAWMPLPEPFREEDKE